MRLYWSLMQGNLPVIAAAASKQYTDKTEQRAGSTAKYKKYIKKIYTKCKKYKYVTIVQEFVVVITYNNHHRIQVCCLILWDKIHFCLTNVFMYWTISESYYYLTSVSFCLELCYTGLVRCWTLWRSAGMWQADPIIFKTLYISFLQTVVDNQVWLLVGCKT